MNPLRDGVYLNQGRGGAARLLRIVGERERVVGKREPSAFSHAEIRISESVCQSPESDKRVALPCEDANSGQAYGQVRMRGFGRDNDEAVWAYAAEEVQGSSGGRSGGLCQGCELWNRGSCVGFESAQELECLAVEVSPAEHDAVKAEFLLPLVWQLVDCAADPVLARIVGQALHKQVQVVGPQNQKCFISVWVIEPVKPVFHGKSVIGGLSRGGQSCEQADCEQGSTNGGRELDPLAQNRSLAGCLGHFNSLCGVLTPSFDHQ